MYISPKERVAMSSDVLHSYRLQVQDLAQGKKNFRIPNRQRSHAEVLIEQIFQSAEETVRLFCGALDEKFYSRPSIQDAVSRFLNKPNTKLYVLTEDPVTLDHPVVSRLTHISPERVQIRCLNKVGQANASHFAVFDRIGFRYEFAHTENGDVEAVANFNEPVTAEKLIQIFDDMFVSSMSVSGS